MKPKPGDVVCWLGAVLGSYLDVPIFIALPITVAVALFVHEVRPEWRDTPLDTK